MAVMTIDARLHPLLDGEPPDWASGWGHDRYGVFVEISVGEATQCLRWIPPGQFVMGSPADEDDRFDDEGPLHEVTIAEGFWLFDTACSEAFWEAVIEEPARAARGPDFPVTDVSWEDVQHFCAQLNAMMPGLDLSLPSEAQWEYACRAGTQTPYSFGEEISRALANYDSDGPVPVGSLPANAWGLYEMHGNVLEWCADYWYGSYDGAPADGSAWLETERDGAADRVLRGGAWYDDARDVRAAFRPNDLAGRDDNLGFAVLVRDASGARGGGGRPGGRVARTPPAAGPPAFATISATTPIVVAATLPHLPYLIMRPIAMSCGSDA
jgi:formylglycine-generating enzyme required for sulfatase activity